MADDRIVILQSPLSPPPSPPAPSHPAGVRGVPVGEIVGSVWHGVWLTVAQHPWVGAVLILALLMSVTGFVRSVVHGGPRDQVRSFSGRDRSVIFARAGGRCEHYGLFGRCRASERLEADHVHPHSRGGWTDVRNGQALCRAHNRTKRAHVPYGWQLRRLEKRRRAYFPPGVPGAVVRHARDHRESRI
jgi:hypothetical protein